MATRSLRGLSRDSAAAIPPISSRRAADAAGGTGCRQVDTDSKARTPDIMGAQGFERRRHAHELTHNTSRGQRDPQKLPWPRSGHSKLIDQGIE
jgi:hypothetical protein